MQELPQWTESAGGKEEWRKGIEKKVNSCHRRAKKWIEKRKDKGTIPTRPEWRDAIWKAVRESHGLGAYSHLSLLLKPSDPTSWNWPSIEHSVNPAVAEVVLEVRLVNDMKTIMSEREFRDMIGHLAGVERIPSKPLPPNWRCKRRFAVEELSTSEPPLPE